MESKLILSSSFSLFFKRYKLLNFSISSFDNFICETFKFEESIDESSMIGDSITIFFFFFYSINKSK